MATLLELRSQLTAVGYSINAAPDPYLTVHTHPLITAPVVLVGQNTDIAKTYQSEAVDTAIRKR